MPPDLLADLIEGPKSAVMKGDQSMSFLSTGFMHFTTVSTGFKDMWGNHDEWVDRMCHFLWIRSPALTFTLKSAHQRYQQFFDLLSSNPGTKLVPPPDIELIWLTHQSSPPSFLRFSRALAGRMVEHNVVSKEQVNQQNILATERCYQGRYGLELQRCLCWDCQNLQRLAEEDSNSDTVLEQLVKQAVKDVAHHRAVECARREKSKLTTRV